MGATELDTSGLSEAEIAALEEDDDQSTDDVDGVADVAGTEDDEDSDNADSDDADANEEDQDTSIESDDDQDAETGEADQAKSKETDQKTVPDAEKATDEDKSGNDDAPGTTTPPPSIDDEIKALDKKLDEGEIDFDTYKKELLLLNRKEIRAEVAQEYAKLKAEETWHTEQKEFFKDNENEYLKENQIVLGAFAAEVNRRLADKAWASKSGTEILAAAKEAIDFAFKIGQAKEEAPVKDDKGKQAVKAAKQASKKDAPQTLKSVPAAEVNEDNKFAYLDNLTGLAYEKAIAQLSEAELEVYSRI